MSKGPKAFQSISEAAAEIGVAQHVLRFWESRFDFVEPVKRAGGRRFYRPTDVAVLTAIRRRLHDEGLTLKGVQRLYDEGGLDAVLVGPGASGATAGTVEREVVPNRALKRALDQVEYARARLLAALAS
ncbi:MULTISPECIES: MerR family transcriptional regulator [Brevundimonas]|uniref:MerR family transcriptional regulator n=1 Tax=Brevundimonas TaxID=41275 RepID=UPI000F02FD32|nr:MerR family transcriptional regulator [Brevundimonas lutea]